MLSTANDAADKGDSSLIGRRLGQFVIDEEIGHGGGGKVYRATQPVLNRSAAIKVLRHRHDTSATVIERFSREARLASRIDHPFAAHIYAFGAEPDGLLWIAMELVRGTPLNRYLKQRGPLPLSRFVPFFERLCEVVQTAHECGVVHSDLKPANIMMISRAGRLLPKLLDLGIARVLHTSSPDRDAVPHEAPSRGRSPTEDGAQTVTLKPPSRGPRVVSGSPLYMAPEQWFSPELVDTRTDIYGLAVLSFQTLTGQPPFGGNSPRAIVKGHTKKPVPPLGPGFPAELDAVLAKAMAKRQDDRYNSVLEFAEALTAVCRPDAALDLPALEPGVAQTWLAKAPQPLAEVIALLEGARNVHQAAATVRDTIEQCAHYIGLLAVACWLNGEPRDPPPASASELLRMLSRHGLAAQAWITLGRELLLESVNTPREFFPIPELLVALAEPVPGSESDGDGTQPHTRAQTVFEEAFAVLESMPGASASDAQMRAYLQRAMAELSRYLRALSFLLDYPLVRATSDTAELWMGVRRARRPTLPLTAPATPSQPYLVDASGTPLVALHPLMQIASPVTGTPAELFLLDGPGRRGARIIARPGGFQQQDATLWDWLEQRSHVKLGGRAATANAERAPYRGLATFTTDDADLFFGREGDAQEFVNRLKLQPLLAVVGPSGAGKSSFIQAGVIPLLTDDWQVVTARPGDAPGSALRARIDASSIEVAWDGTRDIASALHQAVVAHEKRLLLVIDQFEELFTLCQDPDQRHHYVDTLLQLADGSEGSIRVILTLRDDFLMKAQALDRLRDRLMHSLQLLATPSRADLLRILLTPAERVGYSFEDNRLAEQMVGEVDKHPGALALLSFAAAQLWALRDRESKQLRRFAYETMGGVVGALAHHADAVLASMSADELLMVRTAFRHLVTAQGTRAVLTRDELFQILGSDPQARVVLEQLIGARLLVAREGDRDSEQIEITHEALIADWPRLARWHREDAEGAKLRDELRAAVRQWEARERPSWLLWRGEALAEYRLWRARFPDALTDDETRFIQASQKREARGRAIRRVVLVSAFAVLVVGLVVTLWLKNRAASERDRAEASEAEATQRLVELRVEQARQEFVHDQPLRGMAYLEDAIARGADGPIVSHLLASGAQDLSSEQLRLTASPKRVWQADFIADDTRILTSSLNGRVRVWDAQTGALVHEYPVANHIFAVAPNGEVVALRGSDGSLALWALGEPRRLAQLVPSATGRPPRQGYCLAFSRDGALLMADRTDRSVSVWEVATGEERARLQKHGKPLESCAFNSDSSQVATAGTPRIWDVASGEVLHQLGSPGPKSRLTVSPDGRHVLTYNAVDSHVRMWDMATGSPLATLATGALGIVRARYSPDGQTVVLATEDGAAQLWELTSAPTAVRTLTVSGHDGPVFATALSRDKTLLATAGGDRDAIIWDVTRGKRLLTLVGHLKKVSVTEFNRAGDRLLTASADGSARVWATRSQALEAALQAPETPDGRKDYVVAAEFSPDGGRLLSYSRDRIVRLWSPAEKRVVATYSAEERPLRTDQITFRIDTRTKPDFHPSGELIAAPMGRAIRLLDGHTLTPRGALQGHKARVSSVDFAPDGHVLVTASYDNTARVWSPDTHEQLRILDADAKGVMFAAVVAPDSRRVATVHSDRTTRLWDLETGGKLMTLKGHTGAVFGASFSPTGEELATVSTDNTILIWRLDSGRVRLSIDTVIPAFGVAFSPDGTIVAGIDMTGRVTMWDIERGLLLDRFGPVAEFGYGLAFDGTGERIAFANGSALLWNIRRDPRPASAVILDLAARLPYALDGERVIPRGLSQPSSDP